MHLDKKLILIAIIFILAIFIYSMKKEIVVSEVIDGDTIKLSNGELVRLLGINAPEKGQKFYEEAKRKLKEILRDKKIILERDARDKDNYGRLLRYVFADNIFVNSLLVREGYAKPYMLDGLKYKREIEEAWNNCLKDKKNLCALKERCDNSCLGIARLNWNAKGNDCENLNDEYVILKNYCNISCNLSGWELSDRSGNVFIFPEYVLKPLGKVTIYSGSGTNTEEKLYWNSSGKFCNAIWNNDCNGDTLYLKNLEGKVILEFSYKGFC